MGKQGRKKGARKDSRIKTPFGARLRQLRDHAGLSQADLSRASNLSRVFFGAIERGEKAPTIETVEKLAWGLGVAPLELFRFDELTKNAGRASPASTLGVQIAALAKGADETRIARFLAISRIYFTPEGEPVRRGPRRGKRS